MEKFERTQHEVEEVGGHLYIDAGKDGTVNLCWSGKPGVPVTLLDWNIEGVKMWKPIPWNKKGFFKKVISKLFGKE
jgi:hypothetical protein